MKTILRHSALICASLGLMTVAAQAQTQPMQNLTYQTVYLSCVNALFPPLDANRLAAGQRPNSKIYSWDADKQKFMEDCMQRKGFTLATPDYTGNRSQIQKYTADGLQKNEPLEKDVRPAKPTESQIKQGVKVNPPAKSGINVPLWVPREKQR